MRVDCFNGTGERRGFEAGESLLKNSDSKTSALSFCFWYSRCDLSKNQVSKSNLNPESFALWTPGL